MIKYFYNPATHSLVQVLRLSADMKLQTLVGRSQRCSDARLPGAEDQLTEAQRVRLGPIVDLGFAQNGDLYLAEKAVTNQYQLVRVTRARTVEYIVGGDTSHVSDECVCEAGNCTQCLHMNHGGSLLADQVIFKSLSSFTLTPHGDIVVADNQALQIFTIKTQLPEANNEGNYEIVDAESGEIYTFNKFGQHMKTTDMLTSEQKFEFKYSKTLGFGKLQQVTDSIGNSLKIQRDYSDKVQFLENSYGQKYSVKLNLLGQLQSFQISQRKEVKFDYTNSQDNHLLLSSSSVSSGLLNTETLTFETNGAKY